MRSGCRAGLRGMLTAALLLVLLCQTAGAVVLSTPESAGGADAIYVAGNPNWYPVEYYDAETERYEGVLPELLGQIGDRTGLNFTYICAGEEDQRLRLAQNGQVELVSGCAVGEEGLPGAGMTAGRVLLTIPGEDGEVQVRLVYTEIASPELIETIETALAGLSREELAGIAIRYLEEHPGESHPRWLAPAVLISFLILLGTAVFFALRMRRYQRAAEQDERYDLLTGLGNKAYFTEYFEKILPDQYRGLYCVIFLGFDIIRVNQYYGEAEAEEQLRFAANELSLSVRDNEIAARVSGGGFAVARPSSGEQEAADWTEKLLLRINRFMERYGKDYHPEFRAGIYLLRPSDRDCETALFNARQGYQRAIRSGRPYAFSQWEELRREGELLELRKQTPDALRDREFRMYLQFIVRGNSGRISGAEALSRWDHPRRGLLYPGSYVDLMESEGTIAELDFFIFEEACRQLESWGKQGRALSLSCNFARISIGAADFSQRLRSTAERYSFAHDRLVIEITEDIMEHNREAAFANISECKTMGFRIALDDVGSGYTSFSDLRDYPIDIVKIDRSILNAAVTTQGAALLKGMIALAHSLEMEVLCEGVETKAQCDLLRGLSCDYMQGYYFYRALPRTEAERLLKQRDSADTGQSNIK